MVDSYNRTAVRPLIGTLWVWEPDSPHAIALVKVTRVHWNGEEWFIGTRALLYDPSRPLEAARWTDECFNDLGRFWEACHHVLPIPGPRGHTRSGAPQAGEVPQEVV